MQLFIYLSIRLSIGINAVDLAVRDFVIGALRQPLGKEYDHEEDNAKNSDSDDGSVDESIIIVIRIRRK